MESGFLRAALLRAQADASTKIGANASSSTLTDEGGSDEEERIAAVAALLAELGGSKTKPSGGNQQTQNEKEQEQEQGQDQGQGQGQEKGQGQVMSLLDLWLLSSDEDESEIESDEENMADPFASDDEENPNLVNNGHLLSVHGSGANLLSDTTDIGEDCDAAMDSLGLVHMDTGTCIQGKIQTVHRSSHIEVHTGFWAAA